MIISMLYLPGNLLQGLKVKEKMFTLLYHNSQNLQSYSNATEKAVF